MEAAFVAYCDRLTAGDADAVAALFAADATVEDPLGVRRYSGRDEIKAFYKGAIERASPEVRLIGPVRTSYVNEAAAPLQSRSNYGGTPKEIDIIDVFTFDDDGLIVSMKAYWGDANIRDR
ncbi:MAG: nuclear transport factor 2 family protein [Acidimicrobiales bacterium]